MQRRSIIALIGAACCWPIRTMAQQRAMPVIGYVSSGNVLPETGPAGLYDGLRQTGYVVGQNLAIECFHVKT
jgi:putative ABC transport system substrate-binding protein